MQCRHKFISLEYIIRSVIACDLISDPEPSIRDNRAWWKHRCDARVDAVKSVFRVAVLAASVVFGLASPVLAQGVPSPSWDWVVNAGNQGANPLPAGSVAGYVISVFNTGSDAPSTTIEIPVPGATSFVDATGGTIGGITGCVEVAGATVRCTVDALVTGTSADLVLRFRTTIEEVLIVRPVIPAPDADDRNNAQEVTTTIVKGTDLGLTISGPTTAESGSRQTYSFNITNLGPYAADSYKVNFPVQAGLGAITPPAGCVLSAGVYVCTGASLAIGASRAFLFTGTISAASGSTLTLSASLTDGQPLDPNSGNNTASTSTVINPGSDLAVTKSRLPAGTLTTGQTVTFTLTPSYSGDVPNGLTLVDTFPANYTITAVTATPSGVGGWTCNEPPTQIVSCTRDSGTISGLNVPLGQVTVTATVASAGNPVNSVEVDSAGPYDPNDSNNIATDGGAVIVAPTIDLRIDKFGPNPATGVVDSSYAFRLRSQNIGTTGYSGTVRIDEIVPAGMTVTAISGSGWTCTPPTALPLAGPGTIPCVRVYAPGSPLAPQATTPDINVTTVMTSTGTLINTGRVTAVGGNLPDLVPGNDVTTFGFNVSPASNSADIRVVKTARNPTVIAGQAQIYDVQIINPGPATSLSVLVRDDLNDLVNNQISGGGRAYVSAVASPGVATGLVCSTNIQGAQQIRQSCSMTTLPPCTVNVNCPIVTTTVLLGGNGGPRTNFAVLSSATSDPNLANNVSPAGFTVVARADVTVTKTATPSSVPAGQDLVYVITARNLANGLSAAANVTITDTLPNGLTFVSAVPSAGSCGTRPVAGSLTAPGNNQVICNLGTMSNAPQGSASAQQTVTVRVRPNRVLVGPNLINPVTVSSTTTETDTLNNSASATTTVLEPVYDLLVDKTDSVDPIEANDTTVYTLRVQNRGPSAAENVIVTDTLPTSFLTYQSYSLVSPPPGATCTVTAVPDAAGGG